MIEERVSQLVKLDRKISNALLQIAHDNNMNIFQLLETICIDFLSNPTIETITIKKELLADISKAVKLNKDTAKALSYFAKEFKMTRPELIQSICNEYIPILVMEKFGKSQKYQ